MYKNNFGEGFIGYVYVGTKEVDQVKAELEAKLTPGGHYFLTQHPSGALLIGMPEDIDVTDIGNIAMLGDPPVVVEE